MLRLRPSRDFVTVNGKRGKAKQSKAKSKDGGLGNVD